MRTSAAAVAWTLAVVGWAQPEILSLPQKQRDPVSFSSPAARKLLDHTETHNIQILQDIKAAEKAAQAALIVEYNDTTEAQPPQPGCVLCLPEEQPVRLALNDLFNAMDGYWWKNYTGWRTTTNYCLWPGVSCDDHGVIQTVNLENYGLFGQIPESIGNLTDLRELSLACNEIYGTLPQSLSKLTNLVNLDLHGNDFTGDLPHGLQNASTLLWIDLTYNRLGNYDWLLGQPSTPWQNWAALTSVTGSGIDTDPSGVYHRLDPWTRAGRADTLVKNQESTASHTPGEGGAVPVSEYDHSYNDKTPVTNAQV